MQFNILDLFCGAGGFSSGLHKIDNFKTVLANDFNSHALKTFQNNFPQAKTILGDISDKAIQENIINSSISLKVNMIIGGPPCQGFSLKGKKLGLKDPRNFLFIEYYNFVQKIMPQVFVIENVKSLIACENGYFINKIKELFQSLGYFVNYGVLNAKNFNIPQNRERAIIIGCLDKMIPLPVPLKSTEMVTIADAISDLNYLNSGDGKFESKYKFPPQSEYQKNLRLNSEKLFNHVATNHKQIAIDKLKLIPPGGSKNNLPSELRGNQKFSNTWSRLTWEGISPTIDTRFDTPSNGQNSHPCLHRAITPREAARIQSFDDSFVFYGSKTEICKQIGNAVPPLLAKEIGKSIISSFNKISKKNNSIQIYLDDANVKVQELIKNNVIVNHIITDPPYMISKNNNFQTMNAKRTGVDFGEWDKSFDLYQWIDDYCKILDKDGSIIIFCSYLYISNIINKLENNNIVAKDIIIWQKSNPMPRNVSRRYVQDMEFAIWGVKKNAKWTFNKPDNIPYLRSLYKYPLVSGNEKTFHPTQKKLELLEDLIKVHTNENDLIIDPFMGSGTTCLACKNLNRKCIGIEITKEYFNIAKNRLF